MAYAAKPEKNSENIVVRMPPTVMRRLDAVAVKIGENRSDIIREAVIRCLAELESE